MFLLVVLVSPAVERTHILTLLHINVIARGLYQLHQGKNNVFTSIYFVIAIVLSCKIFLYEMSRNSGLCFVSIKVMLTYYIFFLANLNSKQTGEVVVEISDVH